MEDVGATKPSADGACRCSTGPYLGEVRAGGCPLARRNIVEGVVYAVECPTSPLFRRRDDRRHCCCAEMGRTENLWPVQYESRSEDATWGRTGRTDHDVKTSYTLFISRPPSRNPRRMGKQSYVPHPLNCPRDHFPPRFIEEVPPTVEMSPVTAFSGRRRRVPGGKVGANLVGRSRNVVGKRFESFASAFIQP